MVSLLLLVVSLLQLSLLLLSLLSLFLAVASYCLSTCCHRLLEGIVVLLSVAVGLLLDSSITRSSIGGSAVVVVGTLPVDAGSWPAAAAIGKFTAANAADADAVGAFLVLT